MPSLRPNHRASTTGSRASTPRETTCKGRSRSAVLAMERRALTRDIMREGAEVRQREWKGPRVRRRSKWTVAEWREMIQTCLMELQRDWTRAAPAADEARAPAAIAGRRTRPSIQAGVGRAIRAASGVAHPRAAPHRVGRHPRACSADALIVARVEAARRRRDDAGSGGTRPGLDDVAAVGGARIETPGRTLLVSMVGERPPDAR